VPLVAVAICYEIIFPSHVVDDLFRPDWIFNATNDAWFGTSIGPEQHLASARMRAVEEGLPVIRAANTGISAVIDASGEIVARLDTGETGIIAASLPSARPPTLYASFGDWMLLALILASWSWALTANATAHYRRMRKTVMQRSG
jgi:apolipoprotein N-acyltransferase